MRKLLVVLGLAAGVAACAAAQAGLPRRLVPDTRHINVVYMTPKLVDSLLARLRVFVQEPNEAVLCLYGKTSGDTLYMTEVLEPTSQQREPKQARFTCRRGNGYLGTLHTHLGWPLPMCLPSPEDQRGFANDSEEALYYVMCSNGTGIGVLRDARFWLFAWQ
jgi:hypothetical protein